MFCTPAVAEQDDQLELAALESRTAVLEKNFEEMRAALNLITDDQRVHIESLDLIGQRQGEINTTNELARVWRDEDMKGQRLIAERINRMALEPAQQVERPALKPPCAATAFAVYSEHKRRGPAENGASSNRDP